jgi:GTP-binding protein
MQIRFIKTAVLPRDWPPVGPAEVAMVGRSNAGKSSLINSMTGTKIAKVSSTPGKTRALNFFDVNGAYRLTDMPGYGYAARAGDEMSGWRDMIESYLFTRSPLVGLVLVMDIRRKWTDDEQSIVDIMTQIERPVLIALTKSDKVGGNEKRQTVKNIKKNVGHDGVVAVSNSKRIGSDLVEDYIYKNWVESFLPMNPFAQTEASE